jgi:hypothetical protein
MNTWGNDSDGKSVNTTSLIPGSLRIQHDGASNFVVAQNDQVSDSLEVKKVQGDSLSYYDSLIRETWVPELPAVPASRLGKYAMSRIGNANFSGQYIYRTQPVIEKFSDNLDTVFIRYGYNSVSVQDYESTVHPFSQYQSLENGTWKWNTAHQYTWNFASSSIDNGVLRLNSYDDEVAQSIFMIEQDEYNAWIVQYENDFPTVWLSDLPRMDNDVQQPYSNSSEIPSIIENQSWTTHLEANVYIEFNFATSGELTAQKLIWNGYAWQPYDGLPAAVTSWDIDTDNHVTFDLDGRAYKLQVMTGDSNNDGVLDAEHAIAVWERNLGEPMVWLTDRPTFH